MPAVVVRCVVVDAVVGDAGGYAAVPLVFRRLLLFTERRLLPFIVIVDVKHLLMMMITVCCYC